jgi:L-alanine-DL-glutamate epimerase-like enolase superfamily enzyme
MELHWKLEEQQLELRYTWKISRNASDFKTNFFVKIRDDCYEAVAEVAPNIRYKETPELIRAQFASFLKGLPDQLPGLPALNNHLEGLVICNALRCGIENAFIHYLCKKNKQSVYDFLRVKTPLAMPTAFTLPIMEIGQIEKFIAENDLKRFSYLKIKVNKDEGFETVKEVHRRVEQPLMVDANEDWKDVDDLIRFMEKVQKKNIQFIEQPLPASFTEEAIYLKKYAKLELMADESIVAEADFALLKNQFDGINMKLMKAGGYTNGLALLKEARAAGLKTMIGCMVETSLGISSAMRLCHAVDYIDLDGSLILKKDPFNLLKEEEGQLFFTNA